jgi:RHS repeat-associated protein
MAEAARIDDEIAHSEAQLGFWLGSIAAAAFEGVAAYALGSGLAWALGGLACVFPFGTIAAVVIGVAVAVVVGVYVTGPAGDAIQSAGEAIGETFTTVTGVLKGIGSSDVSINRRKAVRALPGLDFAMCSEHGSKPSYVIEGATTVWINNLRAARKGDAVDCDAKISSGSDNVNFGSPPVQVGEKRSQEISDAERQAAGYLRLVAGIAGGAAGVRGIPCFIGQVAVGLGLAGAQSALMGDLIPHMDYGTNAGRSAGTSIGNWLQGKPVHVPTGAKILPSETDVLLAGAFPLIWSRFYNSMDSREGLLGQGWSTPVSFEIIFRDGALVFIGEQGRENIYDDLEPNESRYNPTEQINITRSAGGHYYIAYPGDDLIYYFGKRVSMQNGERLRVRRAMDLHDNGIDFHYNAAGLVHEIRSSSGQVITLHYSEQNLPAVRLVEIKQNRSRDGASPDSTETLVRYGYSAAGDLISVTDRGGNVVREFAYDKHIMVWQKFATGLQSSYRWDQLNDKGRVIEQTSTDGERLAFQYVDEPLATNEIATPDLPNFSIRYITVTDQVGRVQRFTCNRQYLVERYINPLGAITTAKHDANNRIVQFVDAEGHQTTFNYDSIGQLAAIHNALGQSATIKWHPKFSRVASITNYDGTKWTFEYDELGSLIEKKGPNGFVERMLIDERGLVSAFIDAKGGEVEFAYNDQAQLTRYTDCSNKSTSYAYDELSRLTQITDALGHARQFRYDNLGKLVAVNLPDGAQHAYLYDASGALSAHTNGQGKGTHYARNIRGEVTQIENAIGAQIGLTYDAAFRLNVLTNENGQRYQFVYDAADRVIQEHRVDGTRVTVEYDRNARPIAITHHASLGDDVFTEIEIADEDCSKHAPGTAHAIAGSGGGAATTSIRTELIRDVLGRLIEKRAPSHHYHYRYDAAGRLTEATKLDVVSATANGGQRAKPVHTTRFVYDALGNLIEETATDLVSGQSHTLTHAHDELGNRQQTILPPFAGSNARTQRALNYLYYGSGHLHQINLSTQNEANETAHQLIADIERDDLHQEVLRTQGGLTSRYAYDPMGRRAGAWTRASALQSRPFSAMPGQDNGFAQALAFPSAHEGLLKQYRYDLSGELRQRIHTQQGKTDYGYDAIGRVQSAARSTRGGQAAGEQFRYDPAGNLLDSAVAQAAASSAGNADTANNAGSQYASYATQGQRRGYVHDNLVRVFEDKRYRYDGYSRLAEKRIGKHTIQRFDWDDEHRLIAVHTTRMGYAAEKANADPAQGITQTTRFDYDALGRRVAKHDSFGTTRFIWEGMRLIEERRGSIIVTYVYEPNSYVPLARIDATGQQTDNGGLGTTNDEANSRLTDATDRFNGASDADQFTVENTLNQSHRPASTAQYDEKLITVDHPLRHSREGGNPGREDRLAAANDSRNQPWGALHAPKHRDAKQAHAPVHGGPVEPTLANVYYFHTDQVGLPEELSDQHGQIRWRAAYKTWGNTLSERWEAVNLAGEALGQRAENPEQDNAPLPIEQNLRFQGQYLDRDTGLHYNTFRFYDPDIGRFISPDPIGLNGGLNLQTYALNPLSWIDPWGWCVQANAKSGAAHQKTVTATAEGKYGAGNVASEVYIRPLDANGNPVNYRVRADNTITPAGSTVPTKILEGKGSATAPMTKNQATGYPLIRQNGGIIEQGSGAGKVSTPIPPTPVEVIRPGDLGKI